MAYSIDDAWFSIHVYLNFYLEVRCLRVLYLHYKMISNKFNFKIPLCICRGYIGYALTAVFNYSFLLQAWYRIC